MFGSDRTVAVTLKAVVSDYVGKLTSAKAATVDFAKAAEQSVTKNKAAWDDMGSSMLKFGAVGAGALTLVGKAAIDWESAWTGVRKTVDGTPAQMNELEGSLRNLAKTLPSTHEEIAGVAEAAGQLGVRREDVVGFTKTMIDLGQSTNVSAEEAATAIAQISNVMGTMDREGSMGVQRFASALVDLGNKGASTEREILAMAQRLAGAGKAIGASEADVLGLANAMASVGIEAELGGSSMSRAMTLMNSAVLSGSDKLEAFAKVAGVSARDFADKWKTDPVQAIQMFVAGLDQVQKNGGDVAGALKDVGLKGTENAQVFLRLAGASDMVTQSLKDGRAAWESNTALAEEAAKRYETTESKLRIAGNAAKDAAIDFGAVMAPALQAAAESVSSLAGALQSMPDGAKQVVVGVGAAATAAALLGGTAIKTATSVLELKKAMADAGLSAGQLGKNLGVIGVAAAAAVVATAAFDALGTSIAEAMGVKPTGLEDATAAILKGSGAGKDFRVSLDSAASAGGKLQGVVEKIVPVTNAFGGGLDAAKGSVDSYDKALASLVQSGHADKAAAFLEGQGVSAQRAAQELPNYSAALKDVANQATLAGDASSTSSEGHKVLADAMSQSAKEAEAAARAYKDTQNAIEMMGGGVRAEQAAIRSYKDALADATKTAKDSEATLDSRRAALEKVAEASLAVVTKQMDMGRGADVINATMVQQRAAFIEAATAAFGSADAAIAMADAMGLIPEEIRPQVEAVGAKQSTAEVLELNETIFRLDGKIVSVAEEGAAPSTGRVLELDGAIFGLDSKTVQVNEIGATASGERVVELDGVIYRLQGKDVTVNATVNGLAALSQADAYLRMLDGRVANAWVNVSSTYSGPQRPGGMATGGAVYGPGSGTSDDVPRMLSNGEHVWTAAEVAAAGGHAAVYRMRSAVKDGLMRMATGGAVVDYASMRSMPYRPSLGPGPTARAEAGPNLAAAFASLLQGARIELTGADVFSDSLMGRLELTAARGVS